ncbi:MAG TPA: type IV pilus secretin PilQ [Limnobacter sp.]|nr:type IV pilus secretin PilQ [Limnobacter sp.]
MKRHLLLQNSAWRAFALVLFFLCYAGAAQALTLTESAVRDMPDKTELVLDFDGPLPEKIPMFRISNPDRHVLNFPVRIENQDWRLNLSPGGRIQSSQLIHSRNQSRLILGIYSAYEVAQSVDGHRLTITFSGPSPFLPTSAQGARLSSDSVLAEDVSRSVGKATPLGKGPGLLKVDALSSGGTELLRLEFGSANLKADARLQGDLLTLRIADVAADQSAWSQLDKNKLQNLRLVRQIQFEPGDQALILRLELVDAVHQIRQVGGALELVFSPKQSQHNRQVEGASPVKPLNESQSSVARYSGRPISLDFKNADIRTVMQVFADFTKMNLVLSENVKGKVTVFLKDVPWDQALDIVMRSKGLVSSQSGNVLLVSTPGDLANDQMDSAKRSAQDGLEPLVSRVFLVSYQKTADLVGLIKAEDAGLLSARGTLIADERTSQIFVRDTPSRIDRIASIVTGLDKPVKQVMIEARVVLADTSVSKELGVRIRATSSRGDDFTEIGDQFGSGNFVDTGPAAAANLAYTLFNANATRLVNMQLSALETNDRIRIVSNPRVITSNKEAASIEQGTEIPYQIATSSGATAIEFKEANLKLEVTPQITPDGTVLLEVDVAKDSIGITTAAGPAIDTRRVKTKVLVADGGTVVLGGIFEEDDNTRDQKIPLLGDLPVVGYLFKSKNDSRRRAELLIFLTPVVLSSL